MLFKDSISIKRVHIRLQLTYATFVKEKKSSATTRFLDFTHIYVVVDAIAEVSIHFL